MRVIAAALLIAAAVAAGPAVAAGEARVKTERAETWLTPAREGVSPGGTLRLAFRQKLEPGWHVYWRNPGDSGLPLDLQWTLPAGYSVGDIHYPLPEQIPIGPLANFGHHGEPVFLIELNAPSDAEIGSVASIGLDATWLICADICVPEEGRFSLELPVREDPPPHPVGARVVAAAEAGLPETHGGEAYFDLNADGIFLEVAAPSGGIEDVFFFPNTEGLIEPAAAQEWRLRDGVLRIELEPGFAVPEGAVDAAGLLVVTSNSGERRGYEISPQRREGLAPAHGGAATPGLIGFLLIAFAGGLILNLMPCVFPVVFIKAASLIKSAQTSPAALRRDGLLYMAGVVTTFAALGALLLALRAGGEQLGWGFHLQSPVTVLLSAYILFLVGLNLSGVFNIGASLQTVGSTFQAKPNASGAFLTGVLAVFVAAPCVGPLLSAPLAAAVALPPASGMAIFIGIALGLAAPFLLISFAPGVGRILPKPGPWMTVFKQALAFPVFAAAAFFVWVLAQQAGPAGLGYGLGGAVLLAFAAWAFERSKADSARAAAVRTASALAALAALAPAFTIKVADAAPSTVIGVAPEKSIAFDPATVAALRAEGRAVFIDFTAAWCVTCQFNRMTVFSKPSVQAAFDRENVAFVTADWTRRDPEITAALESFGANGVPLYVYYPPNGPATVLQLPVTERSVLALIKGE